MSQTDGAFDEEATAVGPAMNHGIPHRHDLLAENGTAIQIEAPINATHRLSGPP
jgi:hypothetical protein